MTPGSSRSSNGPHAASSAGSTGRGGRWVAAQFVLMAAALAAGFVPPGWPDGVDGLLNVLGALLAILGAGLLVVSARGLGSALTAFPQPKGTLVTDGLYRYARHPIYGGGVLFFLGWGLFSSPLALLLALGLGVLWDRKSRFEERLLAARYPEYGDYRGRTPRRLLPFVY